MRKFTYFTPEVLDKRYDVLIIGAGFSGAVLAERFANLGNSVLMIDERYHIGGNCHSQVDETTNIEFHTYGTHIFHTSSSRVWNYLKPFTDWTNYRHQVLTTFNGKVYQMPINLETINSLYDVNLKPNEVHDFLKAKEGIDFNSSRNDFSSLEEKAVSQVGQRLYDAFIKGYTKKQWGKDPKDLPSEIIGRLPIRNNYNEDYFVNCLWQGMPKRGYTAIFEKMLESSLITVCLRTEININDLETYKRIPVKIYTGPLDRFFNFQFGKLEWRTLKFDCEVVNTRDAQGTSVMNYADEGIPWTRIHEPRHLHPERESSMSQDKSLIIREFSYEDEHSVNPFYPIRTKENLEIQAKYEELAKSLGLYLNGRLAKYKYIDMDQAIASSLHLFDEL